MITLCHPIKQSSKIMDTQVNWKQTMQRMQINVFDVALSWMCSCGKMSIFSEFFFSFLLYELIHFINWIFQFKSKIEYSGGINWFWEIANHFRWSAHWNLWIFAASLSLGPEWHTWQWRFNRWPQVRKKIVSSIQQFACFKTTVYLKQHFNR